MLSQCHLRVIHRTLALLTDQVLTRRSKMADNCIAFRRCHPRSRWRIFGCHGDTMTHAHQPPVLQQQTLHYTSSRRRKLLHYWYYQENVIYTIIRRRFAQHFKHEIFRFMFEFPDFF